jgi:hypothetical protein
MPQMLYVTKSAAKSFNFTVKYGKFGFRIPGFPYLLIFFGSMLTIPSVLLEVYSRKQPF